jgi:hypothetical protein
LSFQRIDARNSLAILLQQPIIATAKDFGEEIGGHECMTDPTAHKKPTGSAILFSIRWKGTATWVAADHLVFRTR